jgi:hypothetical protein
MKSTAIFKPAIMTLVDAPRFMFATSMGLFLLDAMILFSNRMSMSVREHLVMLAALGGFRALMRSWLRPGYLRVLDAMQKGEPADIDTVLSVPDGFLDALLCNILSTCIVVASVVAGAVPGVLMMALGPANGHAELVGPGFLIAFGGSVFAYFYAWLGVRYAEHAVAIDGLGPLAALQRSWTCVRGRRVRLLSVQLFATVAELLGIGWGFVALGVGVFLGVPAGRLVGDHAHVGIWREIRA